MPDSGKTPRILLVEDEQATRAPLAETLRRAGFATIAVPTPEEALALTQRSRFDLVLLDLNQPGKDAHAVCDALHRDSRVPVVMLADSTSAADHDTWLDGAEDYVIKPVRTTEVIARIRAVLRRTSALRAFGAFHIGDLTINPEERRAELSGFELPLSPKELDLLIRLASQAGEVVTREHLMRDVWGENWFGSAKTLDVHIGWLRKKLGDDPARPRFIHTLRGVGFRLASETQLAPTDGNAASGKPLTRRVPEH